MSICHAACVYHLCIFPAQPHTLAQVFLRGVTAPGEGADGGQVGVSEQMQHVLEAYGNSTAVPVTMMQALRWARFACLAPVLCNICYGDGVIFEASLPCHPWCTTLGLQLAAPAVEESP